MIKVNFRIDEDEHARLGRRAHGAGLTLSAFIRSVLKQAADSQGRYIYSSNDEILATCIQILSIVATSVGSRSPETLARGMEDARRLLQERGLLGEDVGQ